MEEMNNRRKESSEIELAVDTATVNTTYEIFIIILAVFSLIGLTVVLIGSLPAQIDVIILQINFTIGIVFLLDFLRSLIKADNKLNYLRWGWLDLLGGIPFFPLLSYARLARIARGVRRIRKVRASEIRHQFTDKQAQSALLSTSLLALIVIFVASVFVPLLKLVILVYLLISVRRRSRWRPRDRAKLYRITEAIGRWSMVDIFVVTILVALVHLGALASIEAGQGALYFAAVVVITMFAAMTFDPRLIWDNLD